MAILTSAGITFSDTTNLNSKYGIIPQSTHSIFYQASAPTGWTQVTAQSNYALRVVSGTGAGIVAATEFTTMFSPKALALGTTGATTIDNNTMGVHQHVSNVPVMRTSGGANTAGGLPRTFNTNPVGLNNAGGGQSHIHGYTVNQNTNFSISYIDVISCTFN
jgi:hypothetical protein